MKKILIAGFEPFGGEAVNPSAELAKACGDVRVPAGVSLSSVVLPVSYASAFETLRTEIENVKPDVVIAFGQASGRDAIEVERVAINIIDSEQADNDGARFRETPVVPGGDTGYFTTLSVAAIVSALRSERIPARVSNSAGAYVCNALFYRLQNYLSSSGAKTRSGFIHLPYLPEQVFEKEKPSMELATLKRALEVIVATLAP